ncbi:hypothetical protein [Prescottella agglutinans]|uniref:Secreted protein n=1 Tax=Prescottella agglutinans TaxID=1644129 RepID=A0ABT6MAG8_9NOCA|nr:hypothetical protein [Prescottella agglutinans]MDH6281308.1 hypothetical protein [Prescottella agglutinans]
MCGVTASPMTGFRRTSLAACGALALALAPMTADAAPSWGPLAPPNPHLGPEGTSTMHQDAGSSDATPLAGPGTGAVSIAQYPLASACPTLLEGSDGLVVALCTTMIGQNPTVHLLDPNASTVPAGGTLAQLQLTKGSLLGGVYAYLDSDDRLVVVDGTRHLLRIGHTHARGAWALTVDSSVDLTSAIPDGDNVTGLAPDWAGNVWFATGGGVVGTVDAAGVARTVALPAGEQVQNSISTSPGGTSVASTHATYQLSAGPDAQPQIVWRQPYDRGSARKPGQLSWGTGSTPTYFGPSTGSEYVTIVDNADGQVNLLVYRSATGEEVCKEPVLPSGDGGSSLGSTGSAGGSGGSLSGSVSGSTGSGSGSENSPIGVGRSVFVASTYGYPYPTVPAGAGDAVPASAPFRGGMTRVDVDADGQGCTTVWQNQVRSSAVPHLSTADGNIYTMVREGADVTTPLDGFAYAVIDPDTGAVKTTKTITGTMLGDTLQMSALITHDGRYMQGTISGIVSVNPGSGGSGGSSGS